LKAFEPFRELGSLKVCGKQPYACKKNGELTAEIFKGEEILYFSNENNYHLSQIKNQLP